MQVSEATVQSINFSKEVEIAAPADVVWESVMEELNGGLDGEDGKSMKHKLEAWPGGRWYRDLGNNTGHLWAHVQVIKPPKLLELYGPMFMSFAAMSHATYRVKEAGNGSTLVFTYRAHGVFPKEYGEGVEEGWSGSIERIRSGAQQKAKH
jgi:uncharacterized protein YndB with AHSA1/START domain